MNRPPYHHRTGERFAPPTRAAPEAPAEVGADVLARAVARAADHVAASQSRPAREAPDEGVILAALPRSDGTELRVSVHRYEGKPYVRVAPWQRGEGETWWPVKGKGATVRAREVAHVVVALSRALDELRQGEVTGGAQIRGRAGAPTP